MSIPQTDSAGIRQVIRALHEADWRVTYVDDREEEIPVTGEQQALKAITAVDSAFLHVTRYGEPAYVFFVLGNDPSEVVCDYTVNLSDVIDPLTDSWD